MNSGHNFSDNNSSNDALQPSSSNDDAMQFGSPFKDDQYCVGKVRVSISFIKVLVMTKQGSTEFATLFSHDFYHHFYTWCQ